jgi:hypothetical protein
MEHYNIINFYGTIDIDQEKELLHTQIAETTKHIAEINERTISHKHALELLYNQSKSIMLTYSEAQEAGIDCTDLLTQQNADQHAKEDCNTVIGLVGTVIEIDARLRTHLERTLQYLEARRDDLYKKIATFREQQIEHALNILDDDVDHNVDDDNDSGNFVAKRKCFTNS